jgi:predicted transcriptional regulator/predicted nucleotidyltransferase
MVPPIAGENPRAVRDVLRRCHGYLTETWLRKTLGFSDKKSQEVVLALVQSDYIERAGSNEIAYTVTDKGRDLMRASAAKRLRRSTADLALDEFMERVRRVNQNPALLYSVTKVVVFGGFLRGSERLGDVDVAIDLAPRLPLSGNWVERFRQHAQTSGRCFRTFEDEIDWPRREIILALKARKRSISIQSWFSFVEMEKSFDFRYNVLLGNAGEIRSELDRSQQTPRATRLRSSIRCE